MLNLFTGHDQIADERIDLGVHNTLPRVGGLHVPAYVGQGPPLTLSAATRMMKSSTTSLLPQLSPCAAVPCVLAICHFTIICQHSVCASPTLLYKGCQSPQMGCPLSRG